MMSKPTHISCNTYYVLLSQEHPTAYWLYMTVSCRNLSSIEILETTLVALLLIEVAGVVVVVVISVLFHL